ncbi:hypothetical protein RYX41_18505 [Lactiplantibacillus plantarum]|nr:hypothetical protein [Lactiplantibacillus plantarum]
MPIDTSITTMFRLGERYNGNSSKWRSNPLFNNPNMRAHERNRRMGYEKAMAGSPLEPLHLDYQNAFLKQQSMYFLNQHQDVDAVIATDDVGLLRFNRVWSKIRHTRKFR